MKFKIYENRVSGNILIIRKSDQLEFEKKISPLYNNELFHIQPINNLFENQIDFMGAAFILFNENDEIVFELVQNLMSSFPVINSTNLAVLNLKSEKSKLLVFKKVNDTFKIIELQDILTTDIPRKIEKFRIESIENILLIQQKEINKLMADVAKIEDISLVFLNQIPTKSSSDTIIYSSRFEKLKKRYSSRIFYLFLSMVFMVIAFWGFIDQSVQNWDTAWYGYEAITLSKKFYSFNLYEIVNGLLTVGSPKGALTPIIGAVMFPFLTFFGLNFPLLITNTFFLASIIFVITIFPRKYYGKFDFSASFLAATSFILSPGLIYLVIHFWSELSLMFALAVIIFNSFFTQRSNLPRYYKVTSQIVGLTLVALSKISLLPFGFFLVISSAFVFYFTCNGFRFHIRFNANKLFYLWILQLVFIIYGFFWVYYNINRVLDFSLRAAFGDFSRIYGHEGTITELVKYWIELLLSWYYPGITLSLLLIFIFSSMLTFLVLIMDRRKFNLKTNLMLRHNVISFLLLLFQAASYIFLLSFQNGKDVRFLAPILIFISFAYFFIIKLFLIVKLKKLMIPVFIVILLSLTFHTLSILNIYKSRMTAFQVYEIISVLTQENPINKTEFVIDTACQFGSKTTVLFAIDQIDFNYNLAQFVFSSNVKERRFCYFTYLGFNPSSKMEIFDKLSQNLQFDYVTTIDTRSIPDPVFNNKFILDVNQFIIESNLFEFVSRDESGVIVYKRLNNIK
jgi:hypothetical protein